MIIILQLFIIAVLAFVVCDLGKSLALVPKETENCGVFFSLNKKMSSKVEEVGNSIAQLAEFKDTQLGDEQIDCEFCCRVDWVKFRQEARAEGIDISDVIFSDKAGCYSFMQDLPDKLKPATHLICGGFLDLFLEWMPDVIKPSC